MCSPKIHNKLPTGKQGAYLINKEIIPCIKLTGGIP